MSNQTLKEFSREEWFNNFPANELILVADAHAIDLEQMKMTLQSFCPARVFEYFHEGQEVISRVEQCLSKAIQSARSYPLCPLRALILDYNIPGKNGLEIIKEVNELYERQRKAYDLYEAVGKELVGPKCVILTAVSANTKAYKYIEKNGGDIVIVKPYDS